VVMFILVCGALRGVAGRVRLGFVCRSVFMMFTRLLTRATAQVIPRRS